MPNFIFSIFSFVQDCSGYSEDSPASPAPGAQLYVRRMPVPIAPKPQSGSGNKNGILSFEDTRSHPTQLVIIPHAAFRNNRIPAHVICSKNLPERQKEKAHCFSGVPLHFQTFSYSVLFRFNTFYIQNSKHVSRNY
jgi:hypothetical protein